jgi:hypothetical protein
MCITARLKFQKFFKYFFTGPPHSIYSLRERAGPFYEARVLGFARGSWRWGCAEEWLGLDQLLLRMLAVSKTQKNPELYTQGYPITYDRNSFFKKACIYLLHTSKVETRRVKQQLQKWKLSD